MRLLVTRPREQGARLAKELEALGHAALLCPLLEPVFEGTLPDLGRFGALVFTSQNGVAALARLTEDRDLPAFTVGGATREAALAAGFETVVSAEGDAGDLLELLRRLWSADKAPLLHVSGAEQAADLAEGLAGDGLALERAVLYRMERMEELPEDVRTALASEELDAVLFFSPRTASVFVCLCEREGLAERCRTLEALCLSPAVADAAAGLPWKSLRTAERPNSQSLLNLLPG